MEILLLYDYRPSERFFPSSGLQVLGWYTANWLRKEGHSVIEDNLFSSILDARRLYKPDMILWIGYWGDARCLKPDTLILGDNKFISEYKTNDNVFGREGIVSVVQPIKNNFNGKLLKIKADGILPFEITPEHPILTSLSRRTHYNHHFESPSWKPAKELLKSSRKGIGRSRRDYLVLPRYEGKFDNKEIDLWPFINKKYYHCSKRFNLPLNEDVAWLLGIYTAEGSSYHKPKNQNKGKSYVQTNFSLNINEDDIKNRIQKILSDLGYSSSFRKREDRNSMEVRFSSYVWARFLQNFCGHGAKNKKIPEIILFHKNKTILQAFLDGYEAGDGYKNSNGISVSTISHLLALQLQLAYARLGKVAYIHERDKHDSILKNGRIIHGGNYYVIDSRLSNSNSRMKIFDKYILTPVKEIEEIYYNGPVYNMETSDNTYIVSNIIVHNCVPQMDDIKKVGYIVTDGVIPRPYRDILNEMDGIIALSKKCEEILRRDEIKKVSTCYPGIDLNLFKPKHMDKRFFYIFSLWIHANMYGDKALLEAMPNIIKEHPETKLIFKVQYEQTKEHYSWSKPFVLGNKLKDNVYWLQEMEPYKNMARYYQRSDLYASIGGTIGLEFPFLEASACALPAVGLNAGTTPEIIQDGYNGVLCKNYKEIKKTDIKSGVSLEETYLIPSSEEIAEKIKALISDKQLYKQCSAGAVESSKRFDIKDRIKDLSKKLESI